MKFVITLLLLCATAYAAGAEFLPTSLELTEDDATKSPTRPIKESLALAVIQFRLERRAAELGDAFPAEHVRHRLGNEIATQFNSTLDAYKTAGSTEAANSILRILGIFCVEQELRLFKLQNTRLITGAGVITYEYDVATLRTILDFAQTEGPALPERVLLSALKVVDDRLNTRDFVEYLVAINAETIFPGIQDHALISHTKEVTKNDITQLMTKLCELPSY